MSQAYPPRSGQSVVSLLTQTVRYMLVVIGIGMAVATVFTALSSTDILPARVAEQIATAINLSQVNSAATPVPVVASPTPPLPRIGLVAGHSGPQNDPGAVCPDGLTEAVVNMDIATRVKKGLEANGFIVDLLTEFDDRLAGYKALAVISIHNDSCAFINDLATGFKVAGALGGGARDKATRLVACITDRYPKQTGMKFHTGSVTRDMTEYHSFYEVDPSSPIAIIETGFLNLDRKLLTEQPYRPAQGIIDGILCYALNQPVGP